MGSGRWYRGTQNCPSSKSASLIATWVSRGLWRRRLTGAGLPSTWLSRGGGAPGVACVTRDNPAQRSSWNGLAALAYHWDGLQLRIYYQADDLALKEHCFNKNGWFQGQ